MFSLTSDVSTHRLGGHFVADGCRVVPVCPEMSGPQDASHFGKLGEHFPGGDALYDVHDLGRGVPRRSFQKEMDVIFHHIHLHDGQVPFRRYALKEKPKVCLTNRGQEPLAVLGDPHEVVLDVVSCAATGSNRHADILSSRKRQSSPADIVSATGLIGPLPPRPKGRGFSGDL